MGSSRTRVVWEPRFLVPAPLGLSDFQNFRLPELLLNYWTKLKYRPYETGHVPTLPKNGKKTTVSSRHPFCVWFQAVSTLNMCFSCAVC